jgi:hypothetical protein
MNTLRPVGLLVLVALLLSGCGGGGGGPSQISHPSIARAVIQATSGLTVNPSNNFMQAVVGQPLQLSASGSTDQGSTIASYQWTVTTKPTGSTAVPSNAAAATVSFVPDKVGSYALGLQVTDAQGATSTQNLTFTVTDSPPTTSVIAQVVFNGKASSQPPQQVDVGSVITLDASGSTASGGGALTISWLLSSKPATSTATLPASGATVHFTADVIGEYDVHVTATDATGAYAEVDYVFKANAVPSALVVATVNTATGTSSTIQAVTNYLVLLDGSASSVAAGDQSNAAWTLLSKPSGSGVQLSALSGPRANFVPDVAGTYVVTLMVTDTTTGLSSTFTVTVQVTQGPVALISGSGTPVAAASGPSFASSVGVPVTLRGSGSYEIGGGGLTYAWSITTQPSGSTATIANATTANTSFTPDVNGTYVVQLTVTDGAGAAAISTVTIQVGAYAPVAIVTQPQISVLLGGTVSTSAALSYDQTGLPLTYSWSIDSRPAGSSAAIQGATNTAAFSFKPDVIGTYTASVTVSNGTISSIGRLTITAFSASSGTVPLPYLPLLMKYSRTTDKWILISTNPNALHIVDPSGATDVAVPLPAAAKDVGVSPDGTLAAVLHEGVVSVVDLTNGALLHSWPTNGSQTMVLIANSGLMYLTGQTGGQWLTPGMTVLNSSTGATVQSYSGGTVFYGSMLGVYADLSNQIFVVSSGLSPTQTYSLALNPTSGQITGTGQSPYWGTYPMGSPMWLSSDESLLFTAAGTYFSTNGLTYVGTLGLTAPVLSVSDDTATAEVVALVENETAPYSFTYTYPSAYLLYTGSLIFSQGSVPLPMVAGVQSYGLAMFHSSNGKHVMIVQTGTSQPNGAGAQYYALLR